MQPLTGSYPMPFPTDGPRLHMHVYVLLWLHKVVEGVLASIVQGREVQHGTCNSFQMPDEMQVLVPDLPSEHACIKSKMMGRSDSQ
jgi:hypothetical protein